MRTDDWSRRVPPSIRTVMYIHRGPGHDSARMRKSALTLESDDVTSPVSRSPKYDIFPPVAVSSIKNYSSHTQFIYGRRVRVVFLYCSWSLGKERLSHYRGHKITGVQRNDDINSSSASAFVKRLRWKERSSNHVSHRQGIGQLREERAPTGGSQEAQPAPSVLDGTTGGSCDAASECRSLRRGESNV